MQIDNEVLTLDTLPTDIKAFLLTFLSPSDLGVMALVCRSYGQLVTTLIAHLPFASAIKEEIIALGYPMPHVSRIFVGISKLSQQISFLQLLRNHHGVRDAFGLIEKLNNPTLGISADLEERFRACQEDIERMLKLPVSEEESEAVLKTAISDLPEFTSKTPPIYNQILLRVYCEVLRIAALINSSQKTNGSLYKKLFLSSYLLTKLGDPTGCFCIVDLAVKSQMQKKNEMLLYFKSVLGFTGENEDFIKGLRVSALIQNKVPLGKLEIDSQLNALLQNFDYTLAFFYPQIVLKLLKNLIEKYKAYGFVIYSTISRGLYQCLVADFELFFNKIFGNQLESLELLANAFQKNKQKTLDTLLTVATKQSKLFQGLTLADILAIPYSLVPILRIYPVSDVENWDVDYVIFLDAKINKLTQAPSILKYWTAEDIRLFLDNTKLFSLVVSCGHQETLFSYLGYYDLLVLMEKNHTYNKSLLELFCEKDNLLIIKLLMDKTSDANQLKNQIRANQALKKLLKTSNKDLLFSKFPKYLHLLRSNRLNVNQSFRIVLTIIADKELFELILSLSHGELSLVEKNCHLIELLRNKMVFDYVKKWSLSFNDIETHYELFQIIAAKAQEQSHRSLLRIAFDELIAISVVKREMLMNIFSIHSETLFNWLLFDNPYVDISDQLTNEKITIRETKDIAEIMAGKLITLLDNFGFSVQHEFYLEFKHHDVYFTSNFTFSDLLGFEHLDFVNKSFLQYICTMNPVVVLAAINFAKSEQHVRSDLFVHFFYLPFWKSIKSEFGKMRVIYFDAHFLSEFTRWEVRGKNILSYLTGKCSKHLFNQIIRKCASSGQLLSDYAHLRLQKLPSLNKINITLFINLVIALSESGFLFNAKKCCELLKRFTAEEIIFLHSERDAENRFSHLQYLALVSQQSTNFKLFLRNLTTLSDMVKVTEELMGEGQPMPFRYSIVMGSLGGDKKHFLSPKVRRRPLKKQRKDDGQETEEDEKIDSDHCEEEDPCDHPGARL